MAGSTDRVPSPKHVRESGLGQILGGKRITSENTRQAKQRLTPGRDILLEIQPCFPSEPATTSDVVRPQNRCKSPIAPPRRSAHAPSDGEWPLIHDALHHDRRGELPNARKGAELLVADALVGGQVGGDDANEIVRVAEQPLSMPYGWNLR